MLPKNRYLRDVRAGPGFFGEGVVYNSHCTKTKQAGMKLDIVKNLKNIAERVAGAARRAERDPKEVTLVAVTKNFPASAVRSAIDAGVKVVGESRVQEAVAKQEEIGEQAGAVEWHFIGHLQKNKVKYLLGRFSLIHSVDSYELAAEIDRLCEKRGIGPADILLQINIAGEGTKHGFSPKAVVEEAGRISRLSSVRIRGLMAIPPPLTEPGSIGEENRGYFMEVARLNNEIDALGLPNARIDTLSIGMSDDFEVAIEEGATYVRIGSAIFGERHA
jgi:hypothetical protein